MSATEPLSAAGVKREREQENVGAVWSGKWSASQASAHEMEEPVELAEGPDGMAAMCPEEVAGSDGGEQQAFPKAPPLEEEVDTRLQGGKRSASDSEITAGLAGKTAEDAATEAAEEQQQAATRAAEDAGNVAYVDELDSAPAVDAEPPQTTASNAECKARVETLSMTATCEQEGKVALEAAGFAGTDATPAFAARQAAEQADELAGGKAIGGIATRIEASCDYESPGALWAQWGIMEDDVIDIATADMALAQDVMPDLVVADDARALDDAPEAAAAGEVHAKRAAPDSAMDSAALSKVASTAPGARAQPPAGVEQWAQGYGAAHVIHDPVVADEARAPDDASDVAAADKIHVEDGAPERASASEAHVERAAPDSAVDHAALPEVASTTSGASAQPPTGVDQSSQEYGVAHLIRDPVVADVARAPDDAPDIALADKVHVEVGAPELAAASEAHAEDAAPDSAVDSAALPEVASTATGASAQPPADFEQSSQDYGAAHVMPDLVVADEARTASAQPRAGVDQWPRDAGAARGGRGGRGVEPAADGAEAEARLTAAGPKVSIGAVTTFKMARAGCEGGAGSPGGPRASALLGTARGHRGRASTWRPAAAKTALRAALVAAVSVPLLVVAAAEAAWRLGPAPPPGGVAFA